MSVHAYVLHMLARIRVNDGKGRHCEWVGKTPTPRVAPMAMPKLNGECSSSSNRCLDTTSNCISFGSPQLSQSDSNLSIISEPCIINTPLN